jgi:hypothetical protein
MNGFHLPRGLPAACLLLLAVGRVAAVEIGNLEGLEDIYGRYAPGGDCQRRPRISVDVTGITVERDGEPEKATKLEYAASYGGQAYSGIQRAIFPFVSANGWPVIMLFNYGEKAGALVIEGHDEGYPGGPPLGPRDRALVASSPYARCR